MAYDDEHQPGIDPSGGGTWETTPRELPPDAAELGPQLGVDLSAHRAGHAVLAKLEQDLTKAGVARSAG